VFLNRMGGACDEGEAEDLTWRTKMAHENYGNQILQQGEDEEVIGPALQHRLMGGHPT